MRSLNLNRNSKKYDSWLNLVRNSKEGYSGHRISLTHAYHCHPFPNTRRAAKNDLRRQGIQDTRTPMLLSIPAFWGIGLTTGYILGFALGWGGTGLWLGHLLGMGIAAILFLIRFHQKTTIREQL